MSDHRALAESILNGDIGGNPSATATTQAVVAQVHATLYLAEQQRLANLIAYVQLQEQQYAAAKESTWDFDWSTHQPSLDRHAKALDLIREGLGLA